MNKLVFFTNTDKKQAVTKRAGESKFGDQIKLLTNSTPIYDQLLKLDVDHVIFGIPEDIGVFANHGKSGAYSAWRAVINVLLNTQNNTYNNGSRLAILGYLDFTEEMQHVSKLDQKKVADLKIARKLVETIDKSVTQIVHDIIKAGKKPIIIGGGHNNAYGNIKGASLALNTKINVINLDAHTDFRTEEGRHSGNGFTYAYSEGFLGKYFIFGLHENYTSQKILERLDKLSKHIDYNTFESLFVRKEQKFKRECARALEFISTKPYGIEIDCDAIENIPSSAMTSSGFSANKTRAFLHYFATHSNAAYLHICEAAPVLASKKTANQAAKLISYLITDFMRAGSN